MKRKIALLAALCMVISLSACSTAAKEDEAAGGEPERTIGNADVVPELADDFVSSESVAEKEELSLDEMLEKFEPAGKSIKIDMDAEDPSNDQISFVIDGEGKIQNYTYTVNGMKILMTYDYDYPQEGVIWALAFSEDGTVINEKKFTYEKRDDTKGYLVYNDYYFKDIEVTGEAPSDEMGQ